MVAIVSGNSLGLSLGSLGTLGARGALGRASEGGNGESAYVNAANGNLVLQAQDDRLVSRGIDSTLLRVYNSQGLLNDDNGDNWSSGFYAQQLLLTGTRNAAGSTLTRTDRDGAVAVYAFDAATTSYKSTAGAGAHDRITFDAATSRYAWTDGGTGVTERYDAANGRLVSVTDNAGNTLGYTYNAAGKIATAVDASGETTHYDYSGNNLTQVRTVLQGGATITRVRYGYDASNRLATVTVDLTPADNAVADAKTYVTTYTYDGTSKRVASVAQGDGTRIAFTYVQVGTAYRVATVTDALGSVTRFTYDTAARRTTVTDPLGLVTTIEYDTLGQLTRVAAPPVAGVAQSVSYAYSAQGDLDQVTDGEGRATVMQYDANGNLTLQRDAAGNTIASSYDARNQLLTETVYLVPDPDGAGAGVASAPATTRYVYDAGGKNLLRFELSPEGRVTEHAYNAYGERTSTIQYTLAAYGVSALAVNASPTEAQMNTWVAAQDRTRAMRVDMAYDARGQLQRTTRYAAVAATGAGVVDATNSVTQYVYDSFGNLLSTVSPNNGTTAMTYDGLGRVLTSRDALNRVTVNQYDDAARRVSVTLSNGLVTTRVQDAGGRLVSVLQTNAAAATLGETKYFYDANDRLGMTQDPTGVRQWMLYDEAGRKVADVDGNGSLTEYVYNRNDQVTQTIAYATAVNLGLLVNASGQPLNPALSAVRPAASAADQKSWSAYDTANRLAKTVNSLGAVTELSYDGASRVVKKVEYATLIATAALGAAPAPAAIAPTASAAADRAERYFYDKDGLLLGSLDAEGYLSISYFDSANRLAATRRYSTVSPSAYWASGTLDQLKPANAAADLRGLKFFNAKGQVIASVDAEFYMTEFVYDNNGNVTRTVRYATKVPETIDINAALASVRPAANAADQAVSTTYDALNRVVQVTGPDGTVTQYSYDSVGNLVSTVLAAGQAEVRTLNARFDLQGRLTAELSAEGAALLVAGQTQEQIDALWAQYAVTYTYDAASRRLSATDALGNKTRYYYNSDNELTHTVNALGEVQETNYNALGQVASQVTYGTRIAAATLATLNGGLANDTALVNALNAIRNAALDSRTTVTYNTAGQVASATDALGNVSSTAYNAFGDATSTTTGLGGGQTLVQTASYDRRGLRTGTVSDASGVNAVTSSLYDAFGRVTRAVDANGGVSQQAYDRLGRVVQTIDPANAARSTTYDAFSRVLTQTDALGQVTRYAYNTAARSSTVTTPEGVAVTTVLTRHGQVQTVTDGKGQSTSYAYDRNGNLKTTTTPLTTGQRAYDRANRLIETTDARGVKVAYGYDAAGRVLTTRVDPTGLNLTTTYAYDAKGQQVTVTDPRGTVTTTAYDLKGQALRQTVDAAGLNLQTSYTYDARGKVLTATNPNGTVTQYTYDKLGRRIREQLDPAGLNLTTQYSYDKNGNAVTRTDANGNLSRFAYDADNRMVFSVDALGNTTKTDYDAEGRVARTTTYAAPISVSGLATPATVALVLARVVATAGKDAVLANRYDRDGRLRFTVDGTGAVTEYKYDANGNVTERIGYANTIALASWTGTADPVVTADAARDQRSRSVYDALNRATFVADATGGVVQNVYDGNGNIVRQVQYATAIASTTAPNAVVANATDDRVSVFAYDNANRQAWAADPTGAVTRNEYDAGGNVVRRTAYGTPITAGGTPSSVTLNAAIDRVATMAYDKAGRLTYAADALGYVTTTAYDKLGQATSITRYFSLPASAGAVPAANALDRTDTFTYDAGGRLRTSTDALGATESFTYDALGNKLTFTNKKGSVWTYTYDAAGRAVTETSPVVALTTLTRDGAGNLVENSTANAALVTRMQYDGLGNLTSRTEAYGRPGEERTTSYAYDAMGRQVRVTFPPVGVYAVETAAALAANGQTGLATRTESTRTLSTQTFYDGLGNAVANIDVAGNASHKAYDAMGRVKYEVDAIGYTTAYAYSAFGETTQLLRYGSFIALPATPTSAAGALTAAQVSAAVNATGFDHSADRVIRTSYDKAGRVYEVVDPQAYVYDSVTGQYDTANKLTRSFYNAFGEVVQVAEQKSRLAGTWVRTYSYYDKLGHKTASVDAMGYLTTQAFDAVGNLTQVVERATALIAGTYNASSYAAAVGNADDRVTNYAYDKLNRRTSETRVNVEFSAASDGTSARGNVTTAYGYDALGNLTRTTDANGANTYSYYDALGRVTAVAAPTRGSTVDGAFLTPITVFKRDAHGNVLAKIEHAKGATQAAEYKGVSSSAAPGHPAIVADAAADRATYTAYDLHGHATQVTDANRVSVYSSYTERGELAKTWQAVTGNDGQTRTLFKAIRYDKLGQITNVLDPASSEVLQVGMQAGYSSSATYTEEDGRVYLSGPNSVTLNWSQLVNPAGGTVRVTINYATVSTFQLLGYDEDHNPIYSGVASHAASRSQDFAPGSSASGVVMAWTDNPGTLDGGISSLSYVTVQQLINGSWVTSWQGVPAQATTTNISSSAAGVNNTAQQYNAFGEVVRKGVNGSWDEYFDYDNAGRLWRTNSGDGVDKVTLYDLLGRATAEIRSEGSAGTAGLGVDVRGLASAADAAMSAVLRRTDTAYDDLGRVVQQTGARRAAGQDGVSVRALTAGASVPSSNTVTMVDESNMPYWSGGLNQINVSWSSLAELGSGDVRVKVDYVTQTYQVSGPVYDEDNNLISPAVMHYGVARSVTQIMTAEQGATGRMFSWYDNGYYELDNGVGSVTRVTLEKKNASGQWVQISTQTAMGAVSGKAIEVAAPENPSSAVVLEMRVGSGAWAPYALVDFGDVRRFDASGLAAGTYEYRVTVTPPGQPARVSATGTVVVSASNIAQSISTNGDSVWQRPVVYQKVDRWGNVLELTDPRLSSWKTTYRYNANNQMVQESMPDAQGAQSASSPTVRLYYDRLGRQVAMQDANGNVNGQVYDAAGNLMEERRADGGVVKHAYDAFGNKVRTINALGNVSGASATKVAGQTTTYAYDKVGRLLSTTHGVVNVWTLPAGGVLTGGALVNVTERSTYDQAGRKLTQVNGAGETIRYRYDLAGNLVETTQPLGQRTLSTFDALGRKTAEVDGNGYAATWSYDYFGRLTGHTDIGGARYTYAYDNARQLTSQVNTRGQNLAYAYDNAGQMTRVRDAALDQTTSYVYDLRGLKVRERTEQAGKVYQDNMLSYDALGRLRAVTDSRMRIDIDYDAVGNRTRVRTFANIMQPGNPAADSALSSDRYFKYDSMNRQTVVDGVDSAGNLGTVGHAITYDVNGNRVSDTFYGNRVTTTNGQTVIVGYDEDGTALYTSTPTTYSATQGLVTERYRYDNMGRLGGVERDGVQIDQRFYDGAGRMVQSGPNGTLPTGYAAALNANVAAANSIGVQTRRNTYDANGRLTYQTVLKSDNSLESVTSYGNYDNAGNSLGYSTTVPNVYTANYTNTLARHEGYREARVDVSSAQFQPGATINSRDVNGNLVGITDSTRGSNNRSFVNDLNGNALYVNQGGNAQRQVIVNGEVLGRYGVGINEVTPRNGNGDPNFAQVVDFDFGYAPVTGSYPAASVGAYTVRAGDTLKSIARSAYGDERMWYLIADANNLGGDRDVRAGQTLNVPSTVGTAYNSSTTFKPYDPSGITGDTTPNMAPPSAKGGCGAVGMIIMIVVAVVAAVFTAGAALAGLSAGFSTIMATGASAMIGGGMVGGVAVGMSLSTVGAAMLGGAVGSIVSQGVGIAIGAQQSFSWKQVGVSAIGSGIGAGIGGSSVGASISGFAGGGATGAMAVAAVSSAATQGVSVALGLQEKFSWRGVAASAVSAGVGSKVGEALGGANWQSNSSISGVERFGIDLASKFSSGIAASVVRGGKVEVVKIAADAFGNALGESINHAAMATASVSKAQSADFNETSATGKTDEAFKRKLATYSSLWNRAKNAQDLLNQFKNDDKFFNTVVDDIKAKGYDSVYTAVLGVALKTDDTGFIANAVAGQRDRAYESGMNRAGLLEAVATRGLADLGIAGVEPVSHPGLANLDKDTIAFFGDPTSYKGITRTAWRAMYDTGLTDYRTYEQVGYAAFEKKAGQAELVAGVATLGTSILLNPKGFVSAVKGVGAELGEFTGLTAARLGRLQSFLVGRVDMLYSNIAKPGLESTLRRVEGQIVGQTFETGVVIDDAGKVIVRKNAPVGMDNAISFTERERALVSGNTFTHNHPNGTTFSTADIKSGLVYEAKSVRAVGEELTYVMEIDRSAAGFPAADIAGNAESFMRKQFGQAQQVVTNQLGAGMIKSPAAMGSPEHLNWLRGEVWQQFAKNVPGLTYKVIPTRR